MRINLSGSDRIITMKIKDTNSIKILKINEARKGATGASIITAGFLDNDMVFTKDNSETVIIENAKIILQGLTGAKIISASFVDNDLVFVLDDESTVTIADAKLTLKGSDIVSASFVGNDIVFTRSDSETIILANAITTLKGDMDSTKWALPNGGMVHNGTSSYVSVPSNANLSFPDKVFTIQRQVMFTKLGADQYLFSKWTTSKREYNIGITNTNHITIYLSPDGNTYHQTTFTNYTVELNRILNIQIDVNQNDCKLYINNNLVDTKNNNNLTVFASDYRLSIGQGDGTLRFNGIDFGGRFFNRILSDADHNHYWNNGQPMLAPLLPQDIGGNQTILTSGTLIIGKRYRIVNFITGDNFTNIGASSNATGIEFIATGTTPTVWTNLSQLKQLGCTYQNLPMDMGRLGIFDSSGNNSNGSTFGSPISLPAEQRNNLYRDFKGQITGNTTLTNVVVKGYEIAKIYVRNTTANAVTISIGTSSGGTQVVNAQVIGANATVVFSPNQFYSFTAEQTLFIHSSNWNSSSLNVKFTQNKVGG